MKARLYIIKAAIALAGGGTLLATSCNLTDPWASAAQTGIDTGAALIAEALLGLLLP